MKKRKKPQTGCGKLLDAWSPPEHAGDPIGCLATSFTFSSTFFEEECLSRFLQMDSTPENDGPVYLVEREEKLSQLSCVTAIVDQHHCTGSRSLRWDLLSCRPRNGILHAKISLLQWSGLIRLIIGSANLTEDGYRRNREIYGILDFAPDEECPTDTLLDTLTFLENDVLGQVAQGDDFTSPPQRRIVDFLGRVRETVLRWNVHPVSDRAAVHVFPVMTGSDRKDVFSQLKERWPSSLPPYWANVTSPFFDPPSDRNKPAQQLWKLLRQRGKADIQYSLITEEVPGDEALYIHAPESILAATPRTRSDTSTQLMTLDDVSSRPFHAKSLWIENDRWIAFLIGSSNFTSAGLGLNEKPNIEANLVYIVDCQKSEDAYKQFEKCLWPSKPVPTNAKLQWQPLTDQEDEPEESPLLPGFFCSAVYDLDESESGVLDLTLGEKPPQKWTLIRDDIGECIYSHEHWQEAGAPSEIRLQWPIDRPPSGLWVRWDRSEGKAWWPVNIVRTASLTPPDDLRDLPLDVLISILSSAKPIHRAFQEHLRNNRMQNEDSCMEMDPHRRVDTSQFLLQKTRRIGWALSSMREQLEKPIVTLDALEWKLNGPVGVRSLVNSIIRESGTEEEKAFLIAEVILELKRVRIRSHQGTLEPQVILEQIRRTADSLCDLIPQLDKPYVPGIRQYIDRVREKVTS